MISNKEEKVTYCLSYAMYRLDAFSILYHLIIC